MMRVNLPEALQRIRKKAVDYREDDVLAAFRSMLEEDSLMEINLENALQSPPNENHAKVDASQLDESRVFHLAHIKRLATAYRLRFLDAHLFKGEIPSEAISELKSIQRRQPEALNNFKIMAPASLFELSYQDKDPMLFMPLGNNLYYLVHQWGKDMNPLRKLIVYPFRNVGTLIKSMFVIAFLFQMAIPTNIMMDGLGDSEFAMRIWMTLHVFIALAGIVAMFGYPYVKNFNSVLWNSRYSD
ncbi:hypothetical protein [Phaeocystidibacter luteus]|uniref:Uncharacterized protein n=1 Tax=Phaeocystidibacter luteus TaxID=911197 RepID=A0A6N6RJE8_9FLAO|nr:hypothetical protein [Phaeocystidibacter luteus]KAB2813711.1 hypothetical protein F8C67_06005 [Phaeocystidibacter luteus]